MLGGIRINLFPTFADTAQVADNMSHSDVPVAIITAFLVLVTAGLVVATWKLCDATREHVKHTKELVDAVEAMIKADRLARVAVAIVPSPSGDLTIVLQNVGRVPARVMSLALKLLDSHGSVCGEDRLLPGQGWVQAGDDRTIQSDPLSRVWTDGRAVSALVTCAFHDGYHTHASLTDEWIFDHQHQAAEMRLEKGK